MVSGRPHPVDVTEGVARVGTEIDDWCHAQSQKWQPEKQTDSFFESGQQAHGRDGAKRYSTRNGIAEAAACNGFPV